MGFSPEFPGLLDKFVKRIPEDKAEFEQLSKYEQGQWERKGLQPKGPTAKYTTGLTKEEGGMESGWQNRMEIYSAKWEEAQKLKEKQMLVLTILKYN